jgi:mRNA-degrading endonuclease toxin of MazEF toxin-antitoxin module
MAFEPKPGLVIRYDFLWKEEADQGREEGKDRPCAIIMAATLKADGSRTVVLCPITHAPPGAGEGGVEIPSKVAAHLGLDDARSWIKTHQVNTLEWDKNRPPFGVTPARKGEWAYGQLPQALAKDAFEQVSARARARQLASIDRDKAKAAKGRTDEGRGR